MEVSESGSAVGGDVFQERNVHAGHDGADDGHSLDYPLVIGASVHASAVCEHCLICCIAPTLMFGFCPHCQKRKEEEAVEEGAEGGEEEGVALHERSWPNCCAQASLMVGQWWHMEEQLSWQPAACQHHHPPTPLSLEEEAEQKGEEGSQGASFQASGTWEGDVYGDDGQYL